GGEPVDGMDVAVGVINDVARSVPGKGVVGRVDVDAVAVHHGVGVGAKALRHDGIVLPQRFVRAGETNVGKTLGRRLCLTGTGDPRPAAARRSPVHLQLVDDQSLAKLEGTGFRHVEADVAGDGGA